MMYIVESASGWQPLLRLSVARHVPGVVAGSRCRELLPLLEFTPVADGSSFGAAVIAAAAAHQ